MLAAYTATNKLILANKPCSVVQVERGDGLLPWNGDTECMIDRFDARSLLDFYRDPPANAQQRPKTPAEEKLQEVCRRSAWHAHLWLSPSASAKDTLYDPVRQRTLDLDSHPPPALCLHSRFTDAAPPAFQYHVTACLHHTALHSSSSLSHIGTSSA